MKAFQLLHVATIIIMAVILIAAIHLFDPNFAPYLLASGLLLILDVLIGLVLFLESNIYNNTKSKSIACDQCGVRIKAIPDSCPECGEIIKARMDPHVRQRIEEKLYGPPKLIRVLRGIFFLKMSDAFFLIVVTILLMFLAFLFWWAGNL